MVITSLNLVDKTLKLESYNGLVDGHKIYPLNKSQTKSDSSWNFFRDRDNHAYLKGGLFSSYNNCNNNLVISTNHGIKLDDISNAFILANHSEAIIQPIFEVDKAIESGMELLPKGEIKYHTPKRVSQRENPLAISFEEVKDNLEKSYGLDIKDISNIVSGRSKNGIYHILDGDGKEFIFKYRGNDKEYVKNLSEILLGVPEYFPKISSRKDNNSLSILNVGGGWYWLENFIKGNPLKRSDKDHPLLMGSLIAGLHKSLNKIIQENCEIKDIFTPSGDYFGESTLLSVYLDLAKSKSKQDFLLPYLKGVIDNDLSNKMRLLPKSLINGDLNSSNIILENNAPKIIDSEIFRISPRINEFIAPLILDGNWSPPSYIQSSLLNLIDAYDKASENPLLEIEKKVLPDLLVGAILRYHTVRKIRKGILGEDSPKKIEKDLSTLMEDKKEWN